MNGDDYVLRVVVVSECEEYASLFVDYLEYWAQQVSLFVLRCEKTSYDPGPDLD